VNGTEIKEALSLLSRVLEHGDGEARGKTSLIVCGGAALVARSLVQRVTKDVDVVAMMRNGELVSPAPLPASLLVAAEKVAVGMNLPKDWLNNGPSSGDGGLFQIGLPDGLEDRMEEHKFGDMLSVFFVGRLDQICFKLYAAVDQMGSYHGQDLEKLEPSLEELKFAITWVNKHDSSEGFLVMLEHYLSENGYEKAIRYI
jgi:hypothetical protein